jgi:DNA-binding transcriptional regulator YiaG
MPRAMSARSRTLIRDRLVEEPNNPGTQLAAASLKFGVPAPTFAELLDVSADTVYRWMYTGNVPKERAKPITKLIRSIEKAFLSSNTPKPLVGTVDERAAALYRILDTRLL